MQASLAHWLTYLTAVFFIVDPFAATPAFLVMTAGCERAIRKRMALRAAATCAIILTVFAAIGKYLFRLFGITLPAFKFAGGLLLLLVALDMLQARRSRTRETPEEQTAGCSVEDVGIIPVGIPMLAGPGSISTVMVLVGQAPSWRDALPAFIAVLITSAVCYFVLASADRVETMLGDTRDSHCHSLDGTNAYGNRFSVLCQRMCRSKACRAGGIAVKKSLRSIWINSFQSAA